MTAAEEGSAAIPRATYRLQFHAGFRLADAERLVPYLAALGISHLYASPLLAARGGSSHGYDVVDPSRLNPELGDERDLERLAATLQAHGLGLVLDIVPNHMGVIEAENPWWLDVLENGPASAFAGAFDIEWSPPQPELQGQVLLPVLGDGYGATLEAGEIVPHFDAVRLGFVLHYHGHRFPIDPADTGRLLRAVALPAEAGAAEDALVQQVMLACDRLPPRDDAELHALRCQQVQGLRERLRILHDRTQWGPAWLTACAAALRGEPGNAASFDALDALLQRQAFRLAHWRTANDEINYRRFFDINALAGLRVEDPAVFEAAHALPLRWLARGWISGLRIDHVDGMSDPQAYCERLRLRCAEVLAEAGRSAQAPYVVVEKILAEDEPWPRDWPVHGETGYRYANQANGLFVDGTQAAAFDELTAAFTGSSGDFDAELDAAKRAVIESSLAADLNLLVEKARAIAVARRHTRDLARIGLRAAIVGFAAAFDVYRSYVSERGPGAQDRARIERAAAAARARCLPSQAAHVEFVRGLLLQAHEEADPGLRERKLRFVQRLQQFTAPVMAKSMEDTVFYRHHRLVSLNDVGGDPRRFGTPPAAFHAANAQRLRDAPHTLLAGSTHDSKRSEDVRARLDVLSEMPARWQQALERWRTLAQAQWRMNGLETFPAPGDELLLWQTLVGVWPADLQTPEALDALRPRIASYMEKAVREAKQQSSWLETDAAYEATLRRAIESLLARIEPAPALSDLRRFVDEIAPFGLCNSVALATLKLTVPGVPDIYQGNEDCSFALVDPDNRRPVDFERRQARLATLQALARGAMPAAVPLDHAKTWVTWRLLQWRRTRPALLREGDYEPVEAAGPLASHLVAFTRRGAGGACLVVVPRLAWRASGGDLQALLDGRCWQDTTLQLPAWAEDTRWRDVLCGRDAAAPGAVASLLHGLPVAVLDASAGGADADP